MKIRWGRIWGKRRINDLRIRAGNININVATIQETEIDRVVLHQGKSPESNHSDGGYDVKHLRQNDLALVKLKSKFAANVRPVDFLASKPCPVGTDIEFS